MADSLPVALDVDTGVDDACALLLAALHPGLDLRAVTCVGGNAALDDVVRNTLTVLDSCDRTDVPVAAGAVRPLLERPRHARHVHGEDGMGDLGWPRSTRSAQSRHAVELLAEAALRARDEGRPLTLVPLAPMTNLALLARTFPDAFAAIGRIVFMGGAVRTGNATPSAEFNVFHDPEAAAIVVEECSRARVPMTMYGLDVFYAPTVTRAEADALVTGGADGAVPRAAAELAGRLIGFQCDRFGRDAATIGDAGAVCAVLDPDRLVTRRMPVRVELAGSWTRGRTIVDQRDWPGDLSHDPHGSAPTELDVGLEVDGPAYARLWLSAVSGRVSR